MRTKFSPILKIKSLETDKLQNELIKLENQKRTLQSELEKLKEELKNLTPPTSGEVATLKQSYELISLHQKSIDNKIEHIAYMAEQIKLTEQKYKEAMLEYEKIKHLHELEVQKMLDEIKKQEAKNLDEIGTLLFSRKKSS